MEWLTGTITFCSKNKGKMAVSQGCSVANILPSFTRVCALGQLRLRRCLPVDDKSDEQDADQITVDNVSVQGLPRR